MSVEVECSLRCIMMMMTNTIQKSWTLRVRRDAGLRGLIKRLARTRSGIGLQGDTRLRTAVSDLQGNVYAELKYMCKHRLLRAPI